MKIILKYKISFSWPEMRILGTMEMGTFIITANTPTERCGRPSWSCTLKADKGDTEEATVSSKRQVREHSRSVMLSSFRTSMYSPAPRPDDFSLGSLQGCFVWKVKNDGLVFYHKTTAVNEHKKIHWLTPLNPEHSQFPKQKTFHIQERKQDRNLLSFSRWDTCHSLLTRSPFSLLQLNEWEML